MNTNQPASNSTPDGDAAGMNDAIMKRLNSHRWKNRVLTGLALSVGLLAMVAGIVLAATISHSLMPVIGDMLRDSPPEHPWNGWRTNAPANASTNASENARPAVRPGTNSTAHTNQGDVLIDVGDGRTISSSDPQWRHAVVTLFLGKVVFLSSVAIALLGVGTFLTLLLVIFNRRTTLRQVNESLMQISKMIKELQDSKKAGGRES